MRSAALLVLMGLTVLCSSPVFGGEKGDRPVILGAEVFVADSLLVGNLTCEGLFSDRIVGTVQSGLPAVVELLYNLISHDNKTVTRGLHAYELRYDVWDDFYAINGTDSVARFSTFEEMAGTIQHLRRIAIVPISGVDISHEYTVEFSIAVHPLRGREKQRIIGWVGENVGGQSKASWREQVLNLNDLIEHFFAREKDSANRSDWYRTDFFNPGRLPIANKEAH